LFLNLKIWIKLWVEIYGICNKFIGELFIHLLSMFVSFIMSGFYTLPNMKVSKDNLKYFFLFYLQFFIWFIGCIVRKRWVRRIFMCWLRRYNRWNWIDIDNLFLFVFIWKATKNANTWRIMMFLFSMMRLIYTVMNRNWIILSLFWKLNA
jgi:hypothetical protein